MSSRGIAAAEESLKETLRIMLPFTGGIQEVHESNLDLLVEAIKGLAEAMAEEATDREHNRGDWHRYD